MNQGEEGFVGFLECLFRLFALGKIIEDCQQFVPSHRGAPDLHDPFGTVFTNDLRFYAAGGGIPGSRSFQRCLPFLLKALAIGTVGIGKAVPVHQLRHILNSITESFDELWIQILDHPGVTGNSDG